MDEEHTWQVDNTGVGIAPLVQNMQAPLVGLLVVEAPLVLMFVQYRSMKLLFPCSLGGELGQKSSPGMTENQTCG